MSEILHQYRRTLNYVWDPNSLEWVAEEQPATTSGGGVGGSGTEYTEDAASAANPIGGMLIVRRRDTLSATEVSADNDNIAVNATNKGEIYVKHTDSVTITDGGANISIDDGGTIISVDDGAGSLTVDGTVAATQSGTWVSRTQDGSGSAITSSVDGAGRSLNVHVANTAAVTGTLSVNPTKIEDQAHVAGDGHYNVMAVRKDTPANISTLDNHYEPLQVSSGRLWTSSKIDTALPTGTNVVGGVYITDWLTGTTQASVNLGATSAGAADRSLVVALHPSSPLPAGTNAIGKLTANSGVDIGDVTVDNAAGASAVNIQDGGNSITIDNANLDVALSTRLKPADTLAAVTTVGTITNVVHVDDNAGSLTIDNANLDVALSTRLKAADTLAAVTTVGTITNVVHIDDNAGNISIDDGGNSITVDGSVTAAVTGTVTANAGTNLNTSALALETGGNLATIAGRTPPLGQTTMALSTPVVIASDQTAIPITGSISANSSADVLAVNGDAAYTVGQTGKNLTQTTDGRLRTLTAGVVNDSVENGLTIGASVALSLTSDGRLRVATANESYNFTRWGSPTDWGSDGEPLEHYPLTAW